MLYVYVLTIVYIHQRVTQNYIEFRIKHLCSRLKEREKERRRFSEYISGLIRLVEQLQSIEQNMILEFQFMHCRSKRMKTLNNGLGHAM